MSYPLVPAAIRRNSRSEDNKLKEKKVLKVISEVLKRMPQITRRKKERAERRMTCSSRSSNPNATSKSLDESLSSESN